MGGVAWSREEDQLLRECIGRHGEGKWHRIPLLAGLNRCRKSCRLRWLNYLRPNIKRGNFTNEEMEHIIELHKLYGNKWSLIASRLMGRTSNDVKNYWNCHLSKRLNSHHVGSSETTQHTAKTTKNNIIQCESQDSQGVKTTQNPTYHASRCGTLLLDHDQVATASSEELIIPCVQDASYDDQMVLKQENHGKYLGAEEHMILEELPKDHIHLEEIKMTGSDQQTVWKWDFDDLTFDVDLWTNSL